MRGEFSAQAKAVKQAKREIDYALDIRDGEVFLVQRAPDASQMPGMWELPEIPATNGNGEASFTLRHSITVTDYVVRVMQSPARSGSEGRWVQEERIARLPLTGLARKILRQAQVI